MRIQRGVTLLELMIVITVLAIVLAVGVPGMRELVLNNRQVSAINELVTALQLARSEAITRNVAAPAGVSVCASNDGETCSGTWTDGWIVFTDSDTTSGAALEADALLRSTDAPPGLTITSPGFAGVIIYRRDGRALDAVDFQFCDSRGASKARVVQLGLSGRPAVSRYRADGSAPNCG